MVSSVQVSVILPTYNRAYCLQKTIESILAQECDSMELIVIDDGSSDNTKQLVDSFGDQINYFYQENAGVSKARNKGIELAQGEFVAFADSDDIWRPEKIKKQLVFFQQNPEIALCFTDALCHRSDGSVGAKYQILPHLKNEIYGLAEVLSDPYFGLPTVMVRTDALRAVGGFDPELKTAEDLNLFFNIALNHKIGYLHDKLVDIYVSEDSLSSSDTSFEDNIFVMNRFFEKHEQACRDAGFNVNQALFNINYEYAKSLLWSGQNRSARNRIKIAGKHKFDLCLIYLYLKTFIR